MLKGLLRRLSRVGLLVWESERYWALVRPDALEALSNETFRRVLSWYYAVLLDNYPAKFVIAKSVPLEVSLEKLSSMGMEELWAIHNELGKEFESRWREVRREGTRFDEFVKRYRLVEPNFVHLKVEIAKRMVRSCRFCERRCGVDRASGAVGACRVDGRTYVHSWFLHMGEEAPLVPSGTIFYGGCNFACVYCQNWDISQVHPRDAVVVDARKLALMQKELARRGARNINHVGGDPIPNTHTILESLLYLDVNIAQLWNSNFYMTLETMELLKHVMDIWLPDFKYGNDACAKRLSGIDNYVSVTLRNLGIAIEWGDMIIRHLVLPNHVECCTKPVLRMIAENLPKDRVLVNIMDQYRPEHRAHAYRDIARRPSWREIEEAYSYATKLGVLWREISR